MKIRLDTQTKEYSNDICEIIRLFTGPDSVETGGAAQAKEGAVVTHEFSYASGAFNNAVDIAVTGKDGMVTRRVRHRSIEPFAGDLSDALVYKRYAKRAAKNAVYVCMQKAFPARLPWGSLTGIRPTRLVAELRAQGLDDARTADALQSAFFLERDKALLLIETADNQRAVLDSQTSVDLDVYIGIPFCVSRCVYCSFPGYAIGRSTNVGAYLDALDREINEAGRAAVDSGWKPRCLYVGGGTPTSISTAALEAVLKRAYAVFGRFIEVTVEAGRPDTLNAENLCMLRDMGVGRISINPQTMNSRTLEAIGRNHTPEAMLRAYELARKTGFACINADLILGLPGENAVDAACTLETVLALRPENVTVHTLALKRASALKQALGAIPLPAADTVSDMVNASREMLKKAGYAPYYLYRQKYMTGNFENVGYCLSGKACAYNIDIMEETTSTLALGAGGISKRVFGARTRIERLPNPKSLEHYIGRIGEHIENKAAFFANAKD